MAIKSAMGVRLSGRMGYDLDLLLLGSGCLKEVVAE